MAGQQQGNGSKVNRGLAETFQGNDGKKDDGRVRKKAGEGGAVTEDIVIEVVKEITPKPFVAMAMKSIEPLITKK